MVNIKKINKKLSLKSISKKYKGFSLLELILVLGISSLVAISMIKYEVRRGAIVKAENAGNQLNIVGKALTTYISKEVMNLSDAIPNNSVVTINFNVLRGENQVVGGKTFFGHELLPTSFQPRSSFGPDFLVQLRRKNDKIDGLVITSRPICEKDNATGCGTPDNPIKYDWIGASMKKVGPYSGVTYNSTTTLTGYNAGWQELGTGAGAFSTINAAGLMAYRVFGSNSGEFDNVYLRLDGTSTMQGNLNLGNHNLNNATNIQYSGWLVGNNAAVNLLRSGNIYNSGNLETVNAYATNDINVGRDLLVLRDVRLGQDLVVGRNANVTNDLNVKGKTVLGDGPTKTTIIMGESLNNENSFFNKHAVVAGAVGAALAVGTPEVRTQDILFGAAYAQNPYTGIPGVKTGRVIPAGMYLSDMIPRYSSRGFVQVVNGSTISKPVCPGGYANARIELMANSAQMLSNITGYGAGYGPSSGIVVRSTVLGPTQIVSEAAHNLTVQTGFTMGVSNQNNAAASWTISMGLLGAGAVTATAHTYCDLGF